MAKQISAIVTRHPDRVAGGVAIFFEEDPAKAEQTAYLLEKILDASAHDLKNGTFVLIDHTAE